MMMVAEREFRDALDVLGPGDIDAADPVTADDKSKGRAQIPKLSEIAVDFFSFGIESIEFVLFGKRAIGSDEDPLRVPSIAL